jgi:hypothetical protein
VLHRLLPGLCLAAAAVYGQDCPSRQVEKAIPAPIRLVTFSNADVLPQEKQQDLENIYRDKRVSLGSLERDMDSFAQELAERVRAEYQNMGYFKVEVTGQALKTAADDHVYDLEVQVRNVGPQYRLGEIRFLHATVFPLPQLRELFPMQRGEVFSRVKVAQGLEELRRIYASHGYINYTPVPMTEFDEDHDIVNLTIDSDEGKQFRIGQIDILGVDDATKARVLSELGAKMGDIYDQPAWHALLAKFPDLVTKPEPDVINLRPDEKSASVNVLLDFRKPACAASELVCTFTGSLGHCQPAAGGSD